MLRHFEPPLNHRESTPVQAPGVGQPAQAARSTLLLSLFAAATAVGLSWHFFTQPLRPWPDQGWVLQAAVRHARGEGLTHQMADVGTDVAVISYDRLVYFPPLYPLLISGLLQLGLSVDGAVKLVNAVVLVAGVFGWMWLAGRFLPALSLRLLFAGLLVTAGTTYGSAMVPKGGTTDYSFWAALPYWIGLVLAARKTADARHRAFALGAASALTGVLIGIRWACAVLIPAGGLSLLLPDGRRGLVRRGLAAVAYGLPAVAVYWIYGAFNRAYSHTGSNLLDFITPKWEFHRLAVLHPWESLLTIPLALEPLLQRAWRALEPGTASTGAGALVRLGIPLLLVAGLAWAWWRGPYRPADCARDLRRVVLVLSGTLVLFLAYLSVRYSWGEDIDWTYLAEQRYFRPVWPAVALFWLTLVPDLAHMPRVRVAVLVVLAAGVVYLAQAHVRTERRLLTTADESWQLVERVRALEAEPGLQVVFDMDISDYFAAATPNLIARHYPEPTTVLRLVASRPAQLWLVRRVLLDHGSDARLFETLATRFHARKVWTSSQGEFELYHAAASPATAE